MLIYCIIIVLMTHFWVHKDYMSKTAPTKEYVAYSNFLSAFFMGLNCLYMINWLLSTFCLFVWRCLAILKKLGCNSARSTLGIPSGASGRCRSSRLPDVMPFSRGGQGSDRWASAWVGAWGPVCSQFVAPPPTFIWLSDHNMCKHVGLRSCWVGAWLLVYFVD